MGLSATLEEPLTDLSSELRRVREIVDQNPEEIDDHAARRGTAAVRRQACSRQSRCGHRETQVRRFSKSRWQRHHRRNMERKEKTRRRHRRSSRAFFPGAFTRELEPSAPNGTRSTSSPASDVTETLIAGLLRRRSFNVPNVTHRLRWSRDPPPSFVPQHRRQQRLIRRRVLSLQRIHSTALPLLLAEKAVPSSSSSSSRMRRRRRRRRRHRVLL
mmetsp:Transcript_32560/g.103822  ORF Transcript_32560/g.103822 Transcript_32560/m.103822 type:complete len:215 (+) Transcript_32560:504-1148(+)